MFWWTLRKLNSEDSVKRKSASEKLINALISKDRRIRRKAANAIGKAGDTRFTENLIAALQDEDKKVRKAAADALELFGVPESQEPLAEYRRREEEERAKRKAEEAQFKSQFVEVTIESHIYNEYREVVPSLSKVRFRFPSMCASCGRSLVPGKHKFKSLSAERRGGITLTLYLPICKDCKWGFSSKFTPELFVRPQLSLSDFVDGTIIYNVHEDFADALMEANQGNEYISISIEGQYKRLLKGRLQNDDPYRDWL